MREWLSLYDSKSGGGIYNKYVCKQATEKLNQEKDKMGKTLFAEINEEDFGTNPWSEIILRSREFCI